MNLDTATLSFSTTVLSKLSVAVASSVRGFVLFPNLHPLPPCQESRKQGPREDGLGPRSMAQSQTDQSWRHLGPSPG